MDSLNLRPIEKAKIDCEKKLFARLSEGLVTYDHVDSYEELLNKVMRQDGESLGKVGQIGVQGQGCFLEIPNGCCLTLYTVASPL